MGSEALNCNIDGLAEFLQAGTDNKLRMLESGLVPLEIGVRKCKPVKPAASFEKHLVSMQLTQRCIKREPMPNNGKIIPAVNLSHHHKTRTRTGRMK